MDIPSAGSHWSAATTAPYAPLAEVRSSTWSPAIKNPLTTVPLVAPPAWKLADVLRYWSANMNKLGTAGAVMSLWSQEMLPATLSHIVRDAAAIIVALSIDVFPAPVSGMTSAPSA